MPDWRVPDGSRCVIGVASPYSDDGVEARLAEEFSRKVDVIGLNCLGYSRSAGGRPATRHRETGDPRPAGASGGSGPASPGATAQPPLTNRRTG